MPTRLTLSILMSCAFVGCSGDADDADATPTTDATTATDAAPDTSSACGTCASGKLCCPSRFTGDVARCIDPQLNPENCGECGTSCTGACSGGECIVVPDCVDAGACPEGSSCESETQGRCCPAGTTFIASPADFFGCCPDGDVCGCRQGNCPISVRSAKTDIRYLAPDELAALGRELLATRLATYAYKADASGRQQLGFIIDDGVPGHGIAADQQHVDLYGYVSLAVATLQVQARELQALRAELDALRHSLGLDPATCPAP